MSNKYTDYKELNLVEVAKNVSEFWNDNTIFEKSLSQREDGKPFVFFEGPPSANGRPGIHHVMARTIKDIFCRYKTLKGYYVSRKAGWDTHGLPVELSVEKELGITKEDIGKKISVDEYNHACRREVMKYKDLWDDLTVKMGYWVDLENPYITFKNEYIETLWYLLSQIYKKGLLYKGYTIQPYSPAAGTGLSSHELNMPGCYKDVKDTTCTAQFKIRSQQKNYRCPWGFPESEPMPENVFFLAWTTTPWTLPSNTALAVGPNIDYVLVKTFNPYSGSPMFAILAKPLLHAHFPEKNAELPMDAYNIGDKNIPYQVIAECKGKDLVGMEYEQLIPWVNPGEGAFRVIAGDYVTTEDGTGIVHIAPTFGADDDRVAKQSGVPPLFMYDLDGKRQPMVDKTGKFFEINDLDPNFVRESVHTELYQEYAGRFVKNAYDSNLTEKDTTLDVDLCVMLKQQNKVFKIEKHVHNYPHCWRTDKPILYYPLDSWFIRTTAVKDRMIALNKTINWKPEATGSGRFGNWLENLVDWNLSRSRYWGTPLPIWRTEDGTEEICIESVAQLRQEIDKSIAAGFMKENPYQSEDYTKFDLHRPYIDNVILVSENGKKMTRETDLIDVWFDSGAMPYAQQHYPFQPLSEKTFPADFIAEGVDQTRGWFFTLHAIATMISDSVSYKNVVSNGLVLDKNGNKMSKRLGNAVDPFETLAKYGPDALRWYMITNSQPWDNLKFDLSGIEEIKRKFFGTLYNTYSFFALYANIDGFSYQEKEIPMAQRPEIDRWILSELNSLIQVVDDAYNTYEPTKAGRAIFTFVNDHLSNWYVRLCRRRFWRGDYTEDKISAYQTLYTCLETVAQLSSPIAPFYSDQLYRDLNQVTGKQNFESVHLSNMPIANEQLIDKDLEQRMELAQKICSLILSLRKKSNIRVRQPLNKVMIPVANLTEKEQIEKVSNLIMSEVNIKEIQYLTEASDILVKKIKANFKLLGPKFGKSMKQVADLIATMSQKEINELETNGIIHLSLNGDPIEILATDVDITTEDIEGWAVATDDGITVALDVTITEPLYQEGIARDLVNRIQNLRKEMNFEVTDRIQLTIDAATDLRQAIEKNEKYICSEILADAICWKEQLQDIQEVEVGDDLKLRIEIKKSLS
ncbi:MAG: isoleucine--tRNA ligase [Bacteroidales bacterium]|nr:isoleucine--tRNA ligase [Bacteroidales bacterium]